jgi:hypothetical protein
MTFEVVRFENESPQSIIANLMTVAGIPSEDYDTTGITTTGLKSFVPGYTLNRRTSVRKAIETVMEAFEIDVAEIGPAIIFRARNRAADHVIDYTELAAREADSNNSVDQLALTNRDKITLPRTIEGAYTDIERDYQQNTSRYYLKQTVNQHLASVDLAMVLYPYYVKAWTRKKLQDVWRGQRTAEFQLPPKYIYISPSDVVLIVTDKQIGTSGGTPVVASLTLKVTEVRRGVNGILNVKGILQSGSLFPSDDFDDFDTESKYVAYTNYKEAGDTSFEFMDLPPISTSDISFGVYLAFSDQQDTTWTGVDLLQSIDGGNNYTVAATSGSATPLGTITTGTITAGTPYTVDTNQSFVVTLESDQVVLASANPNNLLETLPNLALVGNEIISFSNVVSLGSRQFQISGPMVRGLRDTLAPSHGTSTRFVLLDSSVTDYAANVDDLGVTIDYKPVTIGLSEPQVTAVQYAHNAQRFRPFRPTEITGTRDGSNNLTITWKRQDRLDNRWLDNVDVTNSEGQEVYQIDVYDGITVVATYEVTDATTYAYTAAAQTSDGLTPGDPVDIRIYQISATVGRGNEAIATV